MTKTIIPLASLLLLLAGCSDPVEAASPSAAQVTERVMHEQATAEPQTDLAEAPVEQASAAAEPAPQPAPAPEPARVAPSPELHAVDGVSLARLAVATAVQDREPVDPDMDIPTDADRVYAFLELRNATDEERTVVVTFERPDRNLTGDVTLSVPAHAPRWRTWAYTRYLRAPGDYAAVVRTPDGDLLGRIPFTVR